MKLVLLSPQQASNQSLFQQIAALAKLDFQSVSSLQEVIQEIQQNPQFLLVFDITVPGTFEAFAKLLEESVGLYSPSVMSNNYIYISNLRLDQHESLAKSPLFGTFLQRYQLENDLPRLGCLLASLAHRNVFDLKSYFPGSVHHQRMTAHQSDQKKDVMGAFSDFLRRWGMNIRASQFILSGFEEMLMNAFYTAPVDERGKHRFEGYSRSQPVELGIQEALEMDFLHDDNMLCASLLDPFGSIQRLKFVSAASRGFTADALKVRRVQVSTSLGVALTYSMSHGLTMCYEPGARTQISLFYKKNPDFINFRRNSRFLSTFVYEN